MRARHDHRLGLRGQFSIPPHLQDVAASYGLRIENAGGGKYALAAPPDIKANLLPASAQGKDAFRAGELCGILEFLRQPVKASTPDHKARVLAHRVFRFMATGSAQIPGDVNAPRHKYLEGDEHVEVETAMRTEDSWRSASEIGGNAALPGAIPDSSYDAARGLFVLRFKPSCGEESEAQDGLRNALAQALRASKAAAPKQGSLHLTGRGLEDLCGIISKNAAQIEPLAARAEFDEQVKTALANIELRAQKPDAALDDPPDFKSLLLIASALTPVLHSDALRDAWTRHHFTARKSNPASGLITEAGILRSVLDHYEAHGGANAAQSAAIAVEFAPLFAFSREIFGALREAAFKSGHTPSPELTQAASAAENFPHEIDNQQYEAMLECVRKSLKLVGPVRSIGGAAVGASKGFFSDMYNFLRESPPLAVSALALAGFLYWTTYHGNGNAGMMDYVRKIPDQSIFLRGPNGFEAVPFNLHDLPVEARHRQNWHYDANMVRWAMQWLKGDFGNPVGLYKHFMFDNYITAPAHGFVNGLRDGAQWLQTHAHMPFNAKNHFINAADDAIQPTADFLFHANIIQNLTHAGFWMYMFGKGMRNGLAGGKMLGRLMAPMGDLACSTGAKIGDLFRSRKQPSLRDRFLDLTKAPAPPSLSEEQAVLITPKSMSARKAWLLAAGGVCAAGVATCAGLDITGHHQVLTDAVAEISGRGAGGGLTASAFTIYNFFEDILLNHVGGGGMLLLQGATLRLVYQKAAGPLSRTLREKISNFNASHNSITMFERNSHASNQSTYSSRDLI